MCQRKSLIFRNNNWKISYTGILLTVVGQVHGSDSGPGSRSSLRFSPGFGPAKCECGSATLVKAIHHSSKETSKPNMKSLIIPSSSSHLATTWYLFCRFASYSTNLLSPAGQGGECDLTPSCKNLQWERYEHLCSGRPWRKLLECRARPPQIQTFAHHAKPNFSGFQVAHACS